MCAVKLFGGSGCILHMWGSDQVAGTDWVATVFPAQTRVVLYCALQQ